MRSLNSTIHMIAVTQARMHPQAIAFVERKREEGMTKREALRCLKRYISRTLCETMLRGRTSPERDAGPGGLHGRYRRRRGVVST